MTSPGTSVSARTAAAAIVFFLSTAFPRFSLPTGFHEAGTAGYPAQSQVIRVLTIRNATSQTVEYRTRIHRSEDNPETRILKPGELHSLEVDKALDINFVRDSGRIGYRVDPGRHYVFRENPAGELELYEGSHGRPDAVDLAPYVQSPMPVVEKMLELAEISSRDVVYDIGCGDGRIVIAAAHRYGARGIGIDIVPERIQEAQAEARRAAVDHLVEFRLEDAFLSDFSTATVVTLYLVPDAIALFRPLLENQLKPGTRVVSHGYPISGWEEKFIRQADVPSDHDGFYYIYLYRR